MKHTIGWAAHAACLGAILLAIWVPFGGRGQWIATAVVLLLLGAMLLGSTAKTTYSHGGEIPERDSADDIPVEFKGIYESPRPTYGKKAEDDR